jgi:putative endonuclease
VTEERITLGRLGEELARKKLRALGYRILETNYRCPIGEIDVVAKDGDVMVFVEIKTRRNSSLGEVKEAVHKRKQHQLSKVALAYLKSRDLWDTKARFDVVAIRVSEGKEEVEIIKDAFELAY